MKQDAMFVRRVAKSKIKTRTALFAVFPAVLVLLTFLIYPMTASATALGALGNWLSTTSLPQATRLSSSVTYNGYVYEVGGYDSTTYAYLSSVDYAPLNADGSVGSWQTTTSLPQATADSSSVIYNGYIYEIGGESSTAPGVAQASVYYAPLNADGSVGSWQTTTSLPQAIIYSQPVVNNGYIYEIGGYDTATSTSLSTVYYAPLNANGTVGAWNTTAALPQGIDSATSAEYNGYVYEIGGLGSSGSKIATVYYAPLNANGTVGAWNTTAALPQTDAAASSVAYNGYIYELGGSSSSSELSTVYYASIALPPNTPNSLGPTASTNGTYSNNNAPTFSFSLSDTAPSAQVQYRIQIANNASFTSPLIDYTSALASQGSTSFTVGQATGSGTYTTGTSGQALPDGSYYWRVEALDSLGTTSSYATANSGAVAFQVDTTPPTVPGTPSTSLSSTTNTTPTWSWAASADSGSGLASTPYTVEWSTSSTFTSNVSSTTAKTNSIVLPVTLTPATWYVRVKTTDAVGNVSNYSAVGSVTITAPLPPSTPINTSTPTAAQTRQTNITTTSSTQTATSSSTMPTQTQATPITLNNYTNYTSGTGEHESMTASQVVYFKVGTETHSVTIDNVGGDYVTLTLRSTPRTVTIQTGDTDEYNVTGSGKPDIKITLLGTRNGTALLSFAAVTQPVVHVVTASSNKPSSNSPFVTILIVFVIGLCTGVWLIWRRKVHPKAQ